jgi:serine/threonine-protein kinase
VYDLGEADGRHFLSMEYVDGEDLAGLLGRIGKLPVEKGLVVAQEIFAGLAAAHHQGVLHRDLKPSNIMLDGRGHVRITDFGLACPSDTADRETAWAGTPLYMAPEQLAGHPATVRADIYAAGLLLYEMFTGRRPFLAARVEELCRLREKSEPPRPSDVVDLPPEVDQLILDCLQPKPADRPASALSVVARLPHGDPLEAILACDETPSPEMVAAAQRRVGLSPVLGAVCVLVGLVLVTLLSQYTTVVGQIEFKAPAVLAERAQKILSEQDSSPASGRAFYGFAYAEDHDQITPVYFWYRQSPTPLVPVLFAGSPKAPGSGSVSFDDPPPPIAGEVALRLTPAGQLVEFRAVPPAGFTGDAAASDRDAEAREAGMELAPGELPVKLTALFRRAQLIGPEDDELEPKDFAVVHPDAIGPVSSDRRMAWRGPCPQTGKTLRVEAAIRDGRPVYFRVRYDGKQPLAGGRGGPPLAVLHVAMLGLVLLLLIGAAILARNNLRRGRADRQGAGRLALYVFAVSLTAWLLLTGRVDQLPHWGVVVMGLQYAVLWPAGLWLFYLALEPYVRRLWPATLIAWNRVLAGRWHDPLVGRDVLVGVLGGVASQIAWQLALLVPRWFGPGTRYLFAPERTVFAAPLHTLSGGRYCVGELFRFQTYAVAAGMGILLLLLVLRLVLRKQWLAGFAYVAFVTIFWPLGVGDPVASRVTAGLMSLLVVYLTTRFGLVTMVIFVFVRLLLSFPLTPELSAWHAGGTTWLPLAVIAALALFGFHCVRTGRPLFV